MTKLNQRNPKSLLVLASWDFGMCKVLQREEATRCGSHLICIHGDKSDGIDTVANVGFTCFGVAATRTD
jgi:hypothetical protein